MKKLVLIAALCATSAAFAQKNKQSSPAAAAAVPSYSSSSKVFSGNFGLNQGAINLGLAIDSGSDNGDLGGSFFLQTEKEDNGVTKVYQVMTFGAHVKLNIFDQGNWTLDLRPGVNISMIADVPNGSGGKDDKTVFGPSLRWGAAYKMAGGKEIGVERLEIWNWFDDDVQKDDAFTSLVFRTSF